MELNLEDRPALAARVRLQTDRINDQPVLLYPEGLLQLNETAHEVIRRCDGRTTIADILYSLGEEFDTSPETLRADVMECLAQLRQRQLILV